MLVTPVTCPYSGEANRQLWRILLIGRLCYLETGFLDSNELTKRRIDRLVLITPVKRFEGNNITTYNLLKSLLHTKNIAIFAG